MRITPCEADDLAVLETLWPRVGLPERFARQQAGDSSFLLASDGGDIVGRGEVDSAEASIDDSDTTRTCDTTALHDLPFGARRGSRTPKSEDTRT